MNTYRELYYFLFRTTDDALIALDEANYGQARQILIAAQQQAENAFLDENFSDAEG